jgi:hypothetical protein
MGMLPGSQVIFFCLHPDMAAWTKAVNVVDSKQKQSSLENEPNHG